MERLVPPQRAIQWYNPHPYATDGAMESHTYGPRRVHRPTQWTTTTGFAQNPAVQHHIAPVKRDVISTVISGLSAITQRPKIDVRDVDINVGNDEVDVGRRPKGRNRRRKHRNRHPKDRNDVSAAELDVGNPLYVLIDVGNTQKLAALNIQTSRLIPTFKFWRFMGRWHTQNLVWIGRHLVSPE